jgi:hypothetical protein
MLLLLLNKLPSAVLIKLIVIKVNLFQSSLALVLMKDILLEDKTLPSLDMVLIMEPLLLLQADNHVQSLNFQDMNLIALFNQAHQHQISLMLIQVNMV